MADLDRSPPPKLRCAGHTRAHFGRGGHLRPEPSPIRPRTGFASPDRRCHRPPRRVRASGRHSRSCGRHLCRGPCHGVGGHPDGGSSDVPARPPSAGCGARRGNRAADRAGDGAVHIATNARSNAGADFERRPSAIDVQRIGGVVKKAGDIQRPSRRRRWATMVPDSGSRGGDCRIRRVQWQQFSRWKRVGVGICSANNDRVLTRASGPALGRTRTRRPGPGQPSQVHEL